MGLVAVWIGKMCDGFLNLILDAFTAQAHFTLGFVVDFIGKVAVADRMSADRNQRIG